MRGMRVPAILIATIVVALPVLAAEGRTPVYLDGTVIAADGSYVVTRDIIGAGAAPATISISAPNVDLDLNGFTVSNLPGGPPVINVSAASIERIRIHNGKLLGGSNAVVRLAGGLGDTVIVEDVRAVGQNGSPSIYLSGLDNIAIRRCRIQGTGTAQGILIDPPGQFTQGIIEKNHIMRTTGGIVVQTGASIQILDNTIESITAGAYPALHGILLEDNQGSLVARNTIADVTNGDGIHLNKTKGCKIHNNVIRHAQQDGIEIDPGSEGNLVLDNVVSDCGFAGGFGLAVRGRLNQIERNTVTLNFDCGIWFTASSSGNAYGRNMARGNGFAGATCGPCAAGLFPPDSCNDGGGNTSFGDNFIPLPLF